MRMAYNQSLEYLNERLDYLQGLLDRSMAEVRGLEYKEDGEKNRLSKNVPKFGTERNNNET